MSSTTPGRLSGSSEARPTQAMRSLWVRMAALLQISDPVQRRPMFVSRRTVTGMPPAAHAGGAGGVRARRGVPASCAVTCHSSSVPLMAPRQAPRYRRFQSDRRRRRGKRPANISVQLRYCTTGSLYRQFTKKARRKLPAFPVISLSVQVQAVLAAQRVRQEPGSSLPDKARTRIHRVFLVALSASPSFPCRVLRWHGFPCTALQHVHFPARISFPRERQCGRSRQPGPAGPGRSARYRPRSAAARVPHPPDGPGPPGRPAHTAPRR